MTVASEIQKALYLEQRGRFAEAVAGYKSIVDRQPGNVDALFLLGRAYCQTGRLQDGAALFRKVIARDPKHAPAHTLLGRVAAQGGDLEGALTRYDRAIAADPNSAMAYANKADALDALGRHAEAVEAYDKALALEPSNLAAWSNRGSALLPLKRNAEAIDSFKRALALRPDMVEIHFNLANALREEERFEEAAAHYRRAIALRPGLADAHMNLAVVLTALSRWDEAVKCCEAVGKLRPDAVPYFTLSSALMNLERYEESLAAIDKLLAVEPDLGQALHQKSLVLRFLGRMDEARALSERALEVNPDNIERRLLLDEFERFDRDDGRAMALLEQLRGARPGGTMDRIRLSFALADLSRRVGQHDQAFQYLAEANALVRERIKHDPDEARRALNRVRETFSAPYLRAMTGNGDPSTKPVFVIGVPRSGTTLTEQILAAHPRVFGAGETEEFSNCLLAIRDFELTTFPGAFQDMTSADFSRLGADYVGRISAVGGDADRVVNKNLGNNLNVGLIHLAMPNARIVYVRRNPVDACMSCYSLNFSDPETVAYAYDLRDLGRYHRAYDELARHWMQVLPAGVMLEVQYEDVVDDLEGQARRIVAHCGLEWDERCLAFHQADRPVGTASVAQVRQPIYRSSIGRWEPYREHIRPLLEALELPVDAA